MSWNLFCYHRITPFMYSVPHTYSFTSEEDVASVAVSQVSNQEFFLDNTPALEIPGESRNSQSCDVKFGHVNSPRSFARTCIFDENIHATRAVTFSAEELDAMS